MRPSTPRFVAALIALISPACGLIDADKDTAPTVIDEADADSDADADADADSDADSDSDADADADSDSDADADTDADADPICDDPPSPLPIDERSCTTAELGCGEAITTVTTGGTEQLSGADYASSWGCEVVGSSAYGGPERMFDFNHPGTGFVTIALDSPCADLDLFAAYWVSDESCLRSGVSIIECEGDVGAGGGSVQIWNNEPSRYVIIVEGAAGEEEPFTLSADCSG